MDRRLMLTVLLFAVFETHCQAPTAGSGLQTGHSYTFSYNTTVLVSEVHSVTSSGVKDVGYQILADVTAAVIWQHPQNERQQMVMISVTSPQLHVKSRRAPSPDGFVSHDSKLDSAAPHPLLMLTDGGFITQVWRHPQEVDHLANLARGVASLFQYRLDGRVHETDSSGSCEVTYTSSDPASIVKTKQHCTTAAPLFASSNRVLDVAVNSHRVVHYTLAPTGNGGGAPQTVTSEERHQMSPAARSDYGSEVLSLQTLQAVGTSQSVPVLVRGDTPTAEGALQQVALELGWQPVVTSLVGVASPQGCQLEGCPKLSELVSQVRKSLLDKSVSSLAAAKSFISLLPRIRAASERDIVAILKDSNNKKCMLQLMDLLGAAQTTTAHTAARKVLNLNSPERIEAEERYLTALAMASHPPREVVQDMIKESKRKHASEKLHETILLTTAALAATSCSLHREHAEICDDLAKHWVKSLDSCHDEECRLLYLRALRNLHHESTVPALLKQVEEGEKRVNVEALRTLAALPTDVTATLRPHLEHVYYQTNRGYDSTSRTLAADILLQSPEASDARHMLCHLHERNSSELNAYVLQRLQASAQRHSALWHSLRRLLADPAVSNYHLMAQGALSSVLERPLFTAEEISGGFGSVVEMGKAKNVKRSSFGAVLRSGGEELELLTFSVYSGGLTGMMGSPDPDDDPEANTRLEMSLFGRQLRPLVLFSSQGELMGLVWSGAGSEKTSALKGTLLLHDHQQRVPLQNGLSAELTMLGTVTFDFSGQIEISLWNRNAHALIENSGAVLLRGLTTVDTPYVRTQVEATLALEARLEATTDMDFSDGAKMCARIAQAPLTAREVVRKQERILGSKHRLRRVRRGIRKLGGTTFKLNQKNSENCHIMFGARTR